VAERLVGAEYTGVMLHDGWSPYDNFEQARHQQCLGHLLRRCHEMLQNATGGAVRFPRRIKELLQAALDLRDRHAAGQVSAHGLAVARGRLDNELADAIFPLKSNAANERLAQHLWNRRDQVLTFLRVPGVDATNWWAELAIRFGVILRKVWGGNRTWVGARAQSVLMSVWRTCWQQGRLALDFLGQLLRARRWPWPYPRDPPRANPRSSKDAFASASPLIFCACQTPFCLYAVVAQFPVIRRTFSACKPSARLSFASELPPAYRLKLGRFLLPFCLGRAKL
jgi:hypothetical protein